MKSLKKIAAMTAIAASSLTGLGLATSASANAAGTWHWYYYNSSSDKACNSVSMKIHSGDMFTRDNFYSKNTFLGISTGGYHVSRCQIFYRSMAPYAGGSVTNNTTAYNNWKENPNTAGNYYGGHRINA